MKIKIISVISIVSIITGILIFMYPVISKKYYKKVQAVEIGKYDEIVKKQSNDYKEIELEKAKKYNESLVESSKVYDIFSGNGESEVSEEYNKILNIDDSGIMGYIEIPKINIKLPIYHGTNSNMMKNGIGHIEKTSFPIGGTSTHSVLVGHTGLARAKLFDDINFLENNDCFNIYVLGNTLKYKVIDIKTVLPDEVSSLLIRKDEDLVTLITCTPKYKNTHRLLVTGSRIELEENSEKEPKEEVEKTTTSKSDINLIFKNNKVYLILFLILIIIFFVTKII